MEKSWRSSISHLSTLISHASSCRALAPSSVRQTTPCFTILQYPVTGRSLSCFTKYDYSLRSRLEQEPGLQEFLCSGDIIQSPMQTCLSHIRRREERHACVMTITHSKTARSEHHSAAHKPATPRTHPLRAVFFFPLLSLPSPAPA